MRLLGSLLFFALWMASCATTPPAPVPAPPAAPAIEPSPEPAPVVNGEYQVSAARKAESLNEIRALVDKLNAIIDRKAFTEWKTYLDDEYLTTYSSAAKLKEYSQTPFLKQQGRTLRNLQDFFNFVVVVSRANVTVDDISFVDENRVKVLTVIDGDKLVLYLLKLYGKEWKISSW